MDEAALSQRAEDSSKAFERQEQARATETRRQERHEMKKERHKWEIILAEVKVEGQQLRDLSHEIKESERLLASQRSNG